MVNRKERIKMNMIGGYIDGSASGQVSLHTKCIKISRYVHFRVGLSVRRPADELTDKCTYKAR